MGPFDRKGRIALVTVASRGIGRCGAVPGLRCSILDHGARITCDGSLLSWAWG